MKIKNHIKTLIGFVLLLITINTSGQIINPVKWNFEQKRVNDKEVDVIMIAKIDKDWHIYSTEATKDGPVNTSIKWIKIKNAKKIGDIKIEGNKIKKWDESFGMELGWYENILVLKQRMRTNGAEDAIVNGEVSFMCCDNESCLPPKKVNFILNLGKKENKETKDSATIATSKLKKENKETLYKPSSKWWKPVENIKTEKEETGYGLWYIFLAGFGGGLLALLTPCVWPIIPMTVSFFLKRSKNKKRGVMEAVFYGISILLIYVLLGITVTLLFGANGLNALSTSAILNLIFFVLMVIFALSFFGLFEIELPASWSTGLNNKAEKTGGLLSIIIMAAVLVIVSFSCTGPIIGTLLVQVAKSGELLAPTIGMLGFAMALSLPFSIFAMFPSWLKSMPKSGNWMNTLKVTLAFVELVFALKFLSVADMTSNWGILPRWLFIGLWAALALFFSLYLLGIIRFPLENKKNKPSKIRRIISIIPICFMIYMISGYFGNNLTAVSAFLPPTENKEVFNDYDKGMEYAEKNNKPVFVDFTGYGCVNCRKMEAAVFASAEVKELLNRFVIIKLYVDEKKLLASPLTVNENGEIVKIETVGEKWSYLQQYKFGVNAQPYYRTLDNKGNALSYSFAYEENIPHFVSFLKTSLKKYSDNMTIMKQKDMTSNHYERHNGR